MGIVFQIQLNKYLRCPGSIVDTWSFWRLDIDRRDRKICQVIEHDDFEGKKYKAKKD